MAKLNKTQKVLKHLQQYGSITSWEAIQEYGATRLSAIIFNLRDKGYKIVSKEETFTDRYGDKSHFVRYFLVSGKPEDKDVSYGKQMTIDEVINTNERHSNNDNK